MYCQKGYSLFHETTLGKTKTKKTQQHNTHSNPWNSGASTLVLSHNFQAWLDKQRAPWQQAIHMRLRAQLRGVWHKRELKVSVLNKKKKKWSTCVHVLLYCYIFSPVLRRVAVHDKRMHTQDGPLVKGIKRLQPSSNIVALLKSQNRRFRF